MKFTVCEQNSPAIKNLIEDFFIPWYVDVDSSTQWYPYASGLDTFTLPLICVIDPDDNEHYLDRSTGIQDADTFYNWLSNLAGQPPGDDLGGKNDPTQEKLTEEARQWLEAHNQYRSLHGVPALSWSDDLAQSAARWAATCPEGHSPEAQNGAYGENIAWSTYPMDPQGPVTLWYNEIELYNFDNQGFSHETGHFTQVIWKNTTQVGCALVEGCANWTYTWVCQYAPPGNVSGQFEENVFPRISQEPESQLTLSESAIVLNKTTSITISGGTPPYQVVSSDDNIVTATVNNQFLELTAIGNGLATVTVTDAQGATATLQVQVQIIMPAPLAVSPNTTKISGDEFVKITGGYPPYSAISSDATIVRAAVDGHNLRLTAVANGLATVTVTDAQGATATLQVQVQLGESSPLQSCPGQSLSPSGHTGTTATTFRGGVSVAGEDAAFHASVNEQTRLNIELQLSIDPEDRNQQARLIVVAGIEIHNRWLYFEKPANEDQPWQPWHGDITQLQGYKVVDPLGEQQKISIFSGTLQGLSGTRLMIYAAYRLKNGDIVFNSEPITILVGP